MLQRLRLHRRTYAAADPRLGHRSDLQPLRGALGIRDGYALRWIKRVASHLGGTRTGMVTRPKRITDKGMRNQFHHVIDVAPTTLEAIGIPQPNFVNGIQQRP